MTQPTPILYLDIEGTVRKDEEELGRPIRGPGDIEVFPEAVEMMRRWEEGGGLIVGMEWWPEILNDEMSFRDAAEIDARINQLCNGAIAKTLWCAHDPEYPNFNFARCTCNRSSPGLLINLEHQMNLVGLQHPSKMHFPAWMALVVGKYDSTRILAEKVDIDFECADDWREMAQYVV